jgi:hypothetical protein
VEHAATGTVETQFPQLENAADVIKSGLAQERYHDIREWRFTPTSFDLLARDLRTLGFRTSPQSGRSRPTASSVSWPTA